MAAALDADVVVTFSRNDVGAEPLQLPGAYLHGEILTKVPLVSLRDHFNAVQSQHVLDVASDGSMWGESDKE